MNSGELPDLLLVVVGGFLRTLGESGIILEIETYTVGKDISGHERVEGVVEAESVDELERVVEDEVVVALLDRDALAFRRVGDEVVSDCVVARTSVDRRLPKTKNVRPENIATATW